MSECGMPSDHGGYCVTDDCPGVRHVCGCGDEWFLNQEGEVEWLWTNGHSASRT